MHFTNLPDEEFDAPLGMTTGAGAIFGATGGVMEAALRTAVGLAHRRRAAEAGVRRRCAAQLASRKPPTMIGEHGT